MLSDGLLPVIFSWLLGITHRMLSILMVKCVAVPTCAFLILMTKHKGVGECFGGSYV